MKEIEKFLEFKGKTLNFIAHNGTWFIAVKPICEVLGLEYTRQFKNLKEDAILSKMLAEHSMVASNGRIISMICLPEQFIYGWLFSINSDAPGLEAYKFECYNILFNHFHGTITGRKQLLENKAKVRIEIERMKESGNSEVQKFVDLQQQEKTIIAALRKADAEVLDEQYTLWKNDSN